MGTAQYETLAQHLLEGCTVSTLAWMQTGYMSEELQLGAVCLFTGITGQNIIMLTFKITSVLMTQ